MLDLTPQVNILADRLHRLRADKTRVTVAITGAPGSGKSTLAAELARRLRDQKCPCAIVPMDGFHLDNALLEQRGLLARKGAPESFDTAGFLSCISRITAGLDVIHPVFDRPRDISIAGAGHVGPNVPVVIVEGNYLLLDEPPWRDLAPQWDLSVRLEVSEADLRARLIHRWLKLNFSRMAATRRAEQNDLPNARRVMANALPADITL